MNNTYSLASAWKPLLLACGLAGAALTGAQAQNLNYPAANASSRAGTYTDLGATGSAISTPNTDDSNSGATDIGFTFGFGGNNFTQFVLNTNGFIRLGATAPSTPYYTPGAQAATGGSFSASANTNLIAPFNTDLVAGTGAGATEYRVYTTGTAPNRVCTIQWKNVSDKARVNASGGTTTIPKQLNNISFQVKLYETTNAVEFVYGAAIISSEPTTATFVVVGLKGAGSAATQITTVTKPSNTIWALPTFQDGNYATAAGTNAFNVRNVSITGGSPESTLPDPGRTYRFEVPVANDASVAQLYNIEQIPTGQGYVYRAAIRNVGTNATTATNVTLTITGANSATQTQAVASLATGAQSIVTFTNVTFPNAGTNNVTVSLPSDGNTSNNTQTATTISGRSTTTTSATFSYIKPGVPSSGSYGFGVNAAGSFEAAFCAAYTTATQFRLNAVRAQLGGDAASEGQTVYAIVADLQGNTLGQSADFVIGNADLATLHTFPLNSVVTVPAGTFLVGLNMVVDQTAYFPMAVQTEVPQRPATFYTLGTGSGNPPTDISTAATVQNIRYMLEAVGFGTTLSTASPSLTRAFTLYPNPSTDGQFTLAVRGANAPDGLRVEVANQLGQRVYTGSVRDNFTNTLDLGNLSNGIYFLTLRNGDEFTTSKVSINR